MTSNFKAYILVGITLLLFSGKLIAQKSLTINAIEVSDTSKYFDSLRIDISDTAKAELSNRAKWSKSRNYYKKAKSAEGKNYPEIARRFYKTTLEFLETINLDSLDFPTKTFTEFQNQVRKDYNHFIEIFSTLKEDSIAKSRNPLNLIELIQHEATEDTAFQQYLMEYDHDQISYKNGVVLYCLLSGHLIRYLSWNESTLNSLDYTSLEFSNLGASLNRTMLLTETFGPMCFVYRSLKDFPLSKGRHSYTDFLFIQELPNHQRFLVTQISFEELSKIGKTFVSKTGREASYDPFKTLQPFTHLNATRDETLSILNRLVEKNSDK